VRKAGALVVGVALLLSATGCGASAAGAPAPGHTATGHTATVTASPVPAEAAGGACYLLDFDLVAAQLGVRFEVSAASNVGDTYTCVLRQVPAPRPDLALSVSPTLADPKVFADTVVPKSATVLPDLGKTGYSRTLPATGDSGPAAEVGWLSGNQRLMILRYRSAAGTADAQLAALLPRLVTLARKVDQASA
jgi:hypothetical protein